MSTSIVPSGDNRLSLSAEATIDQANLIEAIRYEYRQAEQFHRSALVYWARCGQHLRTLRQRFGNKRGGWQQFVTDNFTFSLPTARKMMQLAETYPELADDERDYDQVIAEFALEHPDLAPAIERGINAVLAGGREPTRRGARPHGPNGRDMAEALDGVEIDVRAEVDDPIGLLVSQIPQGLARRLKEGESEAFAQSFFSHYSSNPPNPRQFEIYCRGALALREIEKIRATAERRGRAQRAGRVRLSADEALTRRTDGD